MRRSFGAAAIAALLVIVAVACDKKNPTRPLGPSVSIATIWPNDDGRSWSYRIQAREWDDPGPRYYQTRDSVPPIPSLNQIVLLLGTQPIGPNVRADSATFRLQFQGLMTTSSGVTAQNLTETVLRPGPVSPFGTSVSGRAAGGMPRGLLQDLLLARPDLAPRLRRFVHPTAATETLIIYRPTLFLFGYAWRLTSEWIGTYGDADTAVAWKYLTKNLAPGSEFVHRLVPSLATDVFLRGRILGRQTVQTPAGTFTNAVVCLYSVDYGIGAYADGQGNFVGFYRDYSYGTVTYADSVGPVASYERRLIGLGLPSRGVADANLVLTARSPASLATLP